VKKLFLILLMMSCILGAKEGKAINFPDDFVLDNLPQFIKDLKRTTVLILATNEKRIMGTGFLTTNEKKDILVVANKHQIPANMPVFVRVNAPGGVIDYLAEPYKASADSDIAIMKLKKTSHNQQWVATNLIIPIQMYGNSADIAEGKEVVYIGYPLGLGVEEQNYPVSRQGLIAQVIPGRKTFLVDGFASHGNSGSPVFDKKTGKLLGMVTSFEPDFIDAFENNKLVARLPFNSGISKIVSIEVVKELLLKKD